jgi:hypothetical protein
MKNFSLEGYRALGYQQVTGLTTAQALTVPDGTSFALIVATGTAVRWRDDGTDPTATVGMPLAVDKDLVYGSGQLSRLRFIETAATAVLNVSYYGGQ